MASTRSTSRIRCQQSPAGRAGVGVVEGGGGGGGGGGFNGMRPTRPNAGSCYGAGGAITSSPPP